MSQAPINAKSHRLGLRENLGQFSLLVLVNAFVGAMVGLERVVIPVLAESQFGLASYTAALSFIVTFGAAKALANLMSGRLAEQWGRRRLLILGWLVGLPVPLILLWAPSWGWVVFANVLLGVNQGFAWTMTVVMKVDLVGPRQRGLALGINESAGYAAVSLAAFGSGWWIAEHSPDGVFLSGFALAVIGLLLSWIFVRDTSGHLKTEVAGFQREVEAPPSFGSVLRQVSWSNPRMLAVSQAGLVNNLNDGLAWGLLPLFFLAADVDVAHTALLVSIYPLVWGLGQLGTGALADKIGRLLPITIGMLLQGSSLLLVAFAPGPGWYLPAMIGQGLGTALVYPAFLAVISDEAAPSWRASALGVYRLWRDGGYVVGAVLAGLLADTLGMGPSIGSIGAITLASGIAAGWLLGKRPQ